MALVIGNAGYRYLGSLSNPTKDAADVATILAKSGFILVGGRALLDLPKAGMDKAVRDFGIAARDADVAPILYFGHGVQIAGTNYLVPTDSIAVTEADVGLQMLGMDLVMRQMEASRARLKVVILDACRNNPFVVQRSRTMERGLANMQAPEGTVIGFATQPGNVADDGEPGTNSPYTAALRENMVRPGLGLFELLNDVGLGVMRTTKGRQQPWMSASPIHGRFYFTPPAMVATPTPTPVAISQNPITAVLAPSSNISSGASLPLIQRAYKALDEKNYGLVERILADAIAIDPASALPHSYRGYTSYMQGNDQLQVAQRLANSHATTAAQELRAAVREALRFYGEAFKSFDRAILIDPQYAPVRRHRGNAIVAVFNARRLADMATVNDILDRAIADFRSSVELDPTSKTSANALGEALLLKNNSREAINWFSRAIEMDRTYAAPYSGRCTAYLQLGDHQAATRDARAAAARDGRLSSMPCLAVAHGAPRGR